MIANRRPDARLRLDPAVLGLVPRGRRFFRRDTVAVARSLVGAWVARRWRGRWYGGRIVETEAYLGERDRAAHSWAGRRTPRVAPMYLDGGHLYVFLVYGMHSCANVVTRGAGQPEAVLLRAAEGPAEAPVRLMAGPGKLCAALSIGVADSGEDLLTGDVRIFAAPGKRPRLVVTPRIGVDYAGEAKDWPLRFYDADSSSVSRAPRGAAAGRRSHA
jgi:DNA-3-methyladenine glycosylase